MKKNTPLIISLSFLVVCLAVVITYYSWQKSTQTVDAQLSSVKKALL